MHTCFLSPPSFFFFRFFSSASFSYRGGESFYESTLVPTRTFRTGFPVQCLCSSLIFFLWTHGCPPPPPCFSFINIDAGLGSFPLRQQNGLLSLIETQILPFLLPLPQSSYCFPLFFRPDVCDRKTHHNLRLLLHSRRLMLSFLPFHQQKGSPIPTVSPANAPGCSVATASAPDNLHPVSFSPPNALFLLDVSCQVSSQVN